MKLSLKALRINKGLTQVEAAKNWEFQNIL